MIGALCLIATGASAQMTGTLLTHRPAQTDYRDKNAASEMTRQFARCVVDRSTGRIKAYLDLPVGSPKHAQMSRSIYDREGDECMGMGELQMPLTVFRGYMFEALFLREYGNKVITDFSAVPPIDYGAPYGASPTADGAQAIAMVRFGDCVVRRAPVPARDLLSSETRSSAETRLFAVLVPSLGPCLPSGKTFEFSKSVARGAIAEALYRLSAATLARK